MQPDLGCYNSLSYTYLEESKEMRKTLVGGAFLVSLLMSSVALAEQSKITESETNTTFQVRKNFGGVPHVIVGVGAREAMGMINVYGGAMYVGVKAGVKTWQSYLTGRFMKAGLVSNGQPDLAKIATSPVGRHFLVYGRMPRAIVMSFVRDVRADQVSEAYEDAWDRTKLDRNAAGEALTKFMAAVNHPVKSGQKMTVRTVGNTIFVNMTGANTKVAGNRALVTAIWKNYFGNPPLQRQLRDGMMSKMGFLHNLVH